MRPCDIRVENQLETLTGFHLFSETRSTLVATHPDQSNYLANQQQGIMLCSAFHQPHWQTVKKPFGRKPFCWAKLVYFVFSLSNLNLQGHRLNSAEDALRVCTIYSSSISVKLDKIFECWWCPREGLTLKASKSNSNSLIWKQKVLSLFVISKNDITICPLPINKKDWNLHHWVCI
jgi:hypothetical protein